MTIDYQIHREMKIVKKGFSEGDSKFKFNKKL